MNHIKKFLKNKVVLTAAVIAATVGLAGAATTAQFGPDRPTKQYVQGQPGFDHVTFNSFTGVPNIGDERDFMTGKVAGAPNGFYDPMNQVRDGNEILVRVYVHNNADRSTNADGSGIARNTRVRVEVPEGNLAQAHQQKGYISADNAQPQVITDTLDINAQYPFALDYVEGSAKLDSNSVNDLPLSDEIVRGGVQIGDDKLDGQIPGCFEYVALVTYKVKVKAPNYTVNKSVRVEGEDSTKWRENASVEPGQKVDWMVEFKNTGKTQLDNTVIFDQLPKKMSLVPGSTKIYNTQHPGGVDAGTDAVVGNGIKVGSYAPASNVRVVFKTEIAKSEDLECGTHKLVNYGYAKPGDHGAVKDDASVDVTKQCEEEPEKPTFACDLLTLKSLGDRKIRLSADASASGGAVIKRYIYNFGDGSQPLTTDKKVVEYQYKKDGTFNSSVQVVVEVNGKEKTVSGDNCAASITFQPNKPPITPPSQPGKLPDTGPGAVIATFVGVSSIASLAYSVVTRRLGL